MIIYPAIDILEGRCVRLLQGDFKQTTNYESDPLEIALNYEQQGAEYLHLVDLDGAKAGTVKNHKILERITKATKLKVDFGGGVKTRNDVQTLLGIGANKVNIGSYAVRDQDGFIALLAEFDQSIILSADIRGDNLASSYVQISGWQQNSGIKLIDLIDKFLVAGLKYVSCTDVSKDGTMSGANFSLYAEISTKFPNLNIIASGGVASLSELENLKSLGIHGVIIGKALLDGAFSIKQALNIQ